MRYLLFAIGLCALYLPLPLVFWVLCYLTFTIIGIMLLE